MRKGPRRGSKGSTALAARALRCLHRAAWPSAKRCPSPQSWDTLHDKHIVATAKAGTTRQQRARRTLELHQALKEVCGFSRAPAGCSAVRGTSGARRMRQTSPGRRPYPAGGAAGACCATSVPHHGQSHRSQRTVADCGHPQQGIPGSQTWAWMHERWRPRYSMKFTGPVPGDSGGGGRS